MGVHLLDQYSLLHFASGVIAYFWHVPFVAWFIIHLVFEVVENTQAGMDVINSFPLWPGGKPEADTHLNMAGDQLSAMVGWVAAYALDTAIGDVYKSNTSKP